MIELSAHAMSMVGTSPAVDVNEFNERLWKLNPKGNFESAYINVNSAVMRERDYKGNPVTLDLIIIKYTKYLEQKKTEGAPEKFIGGIQGFIMNRHFNLEFGSTRPPWMDRYEMK